jgi:hypothetical protein
MLPVATPIFSAIALSTVWLARLLDNKALKVDSVAALFKNTGLPSSEPVTSSAIVFPEFSTYINIRIEDKSYYLSFIYSEKILQNVTFPPQPNIGANSNPLTMYMRQPKVYVRLPSLGKYWPPGSIDLPDNGQLPVYSMTARDELLLNIPDALMNGQAVVDVIQNCVPNIKNAWMMPSLDVDALLIAIRIATYGELMKTPIKFTNDVEMEYQVDLRTVLDGLLINSQWDPVIAVSDELTIFVKPLNYKQAAAASLQSYETQKIIQLTNDDSIKEDDKLKMFKESFQKLTESTLGVVTQSIDHIDTPQGSTTNPAHIKEFISNIDKDMFNLIQSHLEKLKEANSVKPVTVTVTDEMKAQGITGDTVEIPLVFDASTFFE